MQKIQRVIIGRMTFCQMKAVLLSINFLKLLDAIIVVHFEFATASENYFVSFKAKT